MRPYKTIAIPERGHGDCWDARCPGCRSSTPRSSEAKLRGPRRRSVRRSDNHRARSGIRRDT